MMKTTLRPKLEENEASYKLRCGRSMGVEEKEMTRGEDHRDDQILSMMWVMIAIGLGTFLSGFGVWILDNIYCAQLRSWRRKVGLPWGIVLEGHGWWHLMTGTGAYFYITWGIWLRHCLNGRQDEYDLRWPILWSLPEVVRTRKASGVASNGEVKKTI